MTQSDRPPGGNLAAYTAYLQGTFYFARSTEADARQAVALYTEAIRLDPRHAQGYAALSFTLSGMAGQYLGGTPAQQAYAQARAAVNTALALDPDLTAAHGARGLLLSHADFERR